MINYNPERSKMKYDLTGDDDSVERVYIEALTHLIETDLILIKEDPFGVSRIYRNELYEIFGAEYQILRDSEIKI